jgi:hypothetical protein
MIVTGTAAVSTRAWLLKTLAGKRPCPGRRRRTSPVPPLDDVGVGPWVHDGVVTHQALEPEAGPARHHDAGVALRTARYGVKASRPPPRGRSLALRS